MLSVKHMRIDHNYRPNDVFAASISWIYKNITDWNVHFWHTIHAFLFYSADVLQPSSYYVQLVIRIIRITKIYGMLFVLSIHLYSVYRVIHKLGSKSVDSLVLSMLHMSLLLSVCMFTSILCIDLTNFIDYFYLEDDAKHTIYSQPYEFFKSIM